MVKRQLPMLLFGPIMLEVPQPSFGAHFLPLLVIDSDFSRIGGTCETEPLVSKLVTIAVSRGAVFVLKFNLQAIWTIEIFFNS
jgi:hypothetical protein